LTVAAAARRRGISIDAATEGSWAGAVYKMTRSVATAA
jgi:hypothetical protein